MSAEVIHSTDKSITIRALSNETKTIISTLLNPQKFIQSEKGLQRDWNGLAELCGISGEKIPNIKRSNDPTNTVLEMWADHNKDESTIDKMLTFLEYMDRFDVIEDIMSLTERDIEHFKQNPDSRKIQYSYIDDRDILTLDDYNRKNNGLPPQTYDAFVLFADDDIVFATELIDTLEKQFNLKLCVKDRDLVGGGIEHDILIQLISRRCRRLVVIVSPAFFASSVHQYLFGFAQVEGIDQRRRKVIPVLIKPCDNLPPDFRLYVVLDYVRSGKFNNFWDKLYSSVKAPLPPLAKEDNLKRSTENLTPGNRVKFNSMVNISFEERDASVGVNKQEDQPKEECLSVENVDRERPAKGTLKKKNSLIKKIKTLIVPRSTKATETHSEKNVIEKNKKKLWKHTKTKVPVEG